MATQSVSLTAALRSTLLSLQSTQKTFDVTQLRLATGKKVNTALDNPSAFFAAQALTNRAGDLSNLLDSIGQSIQALKAADLGIQKLTDLAQQAQAIAQSAQNSLSNSGAFRSGDISTTLQAALGAGAAGTLTLTAKAAPAGATTATATITITATSTLAQVAAAINASTGFSATIVDGSSGAAAGSKRLEIRATNGQALSIAGAAPGGFLIANNAGAGGIAGAELATNGAYTLGSDIASSSNTSEQITLENQYKTVLANINTLVTDSGYQGTNLLNGDILNVQFNEKNTSKLTVAGVTFNASGLGLSFTEGSTFLNATNITASLNTITSALSTLRSQAQTFGNNINIVQTRQDFTTNVINNLKAGSDALTLADKNEEGANLLSLQTAQQLGIQALSLVSQSNQSVLRLFG